MQRWGQKQHNDRFGMVLVVCGGVGVGLLKLETLFDTRSSIVEGAYEEKLSWILDTDVQAFGTH